MVYHGGQLLFGRRVIRWHEERHSTVINERHGIVAVGQYGERRLSLAVVCWLSVRINCLPCCFTLVCLNGVTTPLSYTILRHTKTHCRVTRFTMLSSVKGVAAVNTICDIVIIVECYHVILG